MKQIDEIPLSNPNKLFQTPQKKDKTRKIYSELNHHDYSNLYILSQEKFDLGQSPRFKAPNEININQQISARPIVSEIQKKPEIYESVKKLYSPPIVVKLQEPKPSTLRRVKKYKQGRQIFEETYGNISFKESFKKCYQEILEKLQKNRIRLIPGPEIIGVENQEEKVTLSQLFTFCVNPKNSRKLVFQQEKITFVSVYECLGCGVEFDNPPALGGHLRSCIEKDLHYKRLDKYYKSYFQLNQNSDSVYQVKQQASEDIFKTPQKVARIEDQKITQKHKENVCFFYSSDQKSISKSVIGSERHNFEIEHSINHEEEEKRQIKKVERTLKKIRKVFQKPNKEKEENKRILRKRK